MENIKHTRGFSDSERLNTTTKDYSITARKKLLEKGFQKDKPFRSKNSKFRTKSAERLSFSSNFSKTFFIAPLSQISKNDESTAGLKKTSKSPAATKRTKSIESTKKLENIEKIENFAKKLSKNPKISLTRTRRKKLEKPTDFILKVAEKFSVKKINVINKQDLHCNNKSDEFLGRALIALLNDVDYHIKESQNYPVEVFYEYISSPGIVVQTIKRIPDLIATERIPQRNFYTESYLRSLEFFNEAKLVTNNPGFVLLVELLESIFKYKELITKDIQFKETEEIIVSRHKRKNLSLDLDSVASSACQRRLNSISDLSQLSTLKTIEDLPSRRSFEKEKISVVLKPVKTKVSIKPKKAGFMDSKNILLEKFFMRMGINS